MNIDIRKSIKENFKNSTNEEIADAINSATSDQDEITLPGMGVFFEILCLNSNEEEKNKIISIIKKGLK